MKNIIKYAAVATALASVLAPSFALAGGLVVPTPPVGSPGGGLTGNKLVGLLEQVASFVLTISVIIAVIFIVWGGIQALRGGWDKAKETLTKAAIGLAIIFGVGLIMQTVASIVSKQSIN